MYSSATWTYFKKQNLGEAVVSPTHFNVAKKTPQKVRSCFSQSPVPYAYLWWLWWWWLTHSFSRSVAVKTAGNIVLVCLTVHVNLGKWLHALLSHPALNELQGYWAIQRSWFARVNVLCNLSAKKSWEVAAHFRADFWVGVASCCV